MSVDRQQVQDTCECALLGSQNMLVPWYLILSFSYYHLEDPLVSDEFYDKLCRDLLNEIDQLNIEHEHLHLVDTAALKAGTAFHLKYEDYPSRARSVARRLRAGLPP